MRITIKMVYYFLEKKINETMFYTSFAIKMIRYFYFYHLTYIVSLKNDRATRNSFSLFSSGTIAFPKKKLNQGVYRSYIFSYKVLKAYIWKMAP